VTAAIVAGAAAAAMAIGWALGRGPEVAPEGGTWSWWIAMKQDPMTSHRYVPIIQAPTGEQFELAAELTEFGAENAAERAIRERGGVPLQGKPVG
jgi:hypothetical protein